MPLQKDLKRLIRNRMQKTAESYTAARSQILMRNTPPAARFAELAAMSDDAVRAKTGRTWKQWVRELDSVDAIAMSHKEIAKHVYDSYDVSGWWAQTVTVGYERIRGLREIGQKCDGSFAQVRPTYGFGLPTIQDLLYYQKKYWEVGGSDSKRAQRLSAIRYRALRYGIPLEALRDVRYVAASSHNLTY